MFKGVYNERRQSPKRPGPGNLSLICESLPRTRPVEKHTRVLDTTMAYVNVGNGDPTPSYLWHSIIPYLLPYGRCLAPDYVGMGNSGAAPNGSSCFVDHQRCVNAWFDKLDLKRNVILIMHDWGSVFGLPLGAPPP